MSGEEDLELDEAALWDDDGSISRGASAETTDSQIEMEPGAAVDSRPQPEASDSSTDEGEDLDAAMEGISLQRNSSISRSLGRGSGGDSGISAALQQRTDAADSAAAAAPVAAADPAGLDSRNFRFQPTGGTPASLPISALGPGRPLRTASDVGYMMKQAGLSTESKMGTSVPVAIPSAARRKLAQHGVLTGVNDGIRAATFVPPHQLMAQMEDNGDKFSLDFAKGGISPSASLKRDRLVQRNAILRRTGFIEGGRGASFLETMDPIREGVIEPGSSVGLSSALSAALSSSLPRNISK